MSIWVSDVGAYYFRDYRPSDRPCSWMQQSSTSMHPCHHLRLEDMWTESSDDWTLDSTEFWWRRQQKCHLSLLLPGELLICIESNESKLSVTGTCTLGGHNWQHSQHANRLQGCVGLIAKIPQTADRGYTVAIATLQHPNKLSWHPQPR